MTDVVVTDKKHIFFVVLLVAPSLRTGATMASINGNSKFTAFLQRQRDETVKPYGPF